MKPEKKKKDYNQIEDSSEAFDKFKRNFVKQSLRRASYRWPFKHKAKGNARIDRGFYKCESCGNAFGPKEINLDHKEPVENVVTGFIGWDNYIDRLFIKTSGFQVLCLTCHASKTLVENELRRSNGQKPLRAVKKKKK